MKNVTVQLLVFLAIIVFTCHGVLAQDVMGTVSGTVKDAATGEEVVGAVVKLEGTKLGAVCDLDGSYVIMNVPAGTYTMIATLVGYADARIENIVVKKGAVTECSITLATDAVQVDEVVVKAKAIQETEAAVLKERQESTAVTDAVSAETISKAGGGNAVEAIKQVTGTTVVDGKSVYVRGLGDRYMNVQLNGSELPSTSQYNTTVQVDLFPSSLISNIVTQKTFTPDKPGNFTGGSVDIETKSFPEKPSLTFSMSTSFNPQANLTDKFLTYDSGSTLTGTASDKVEIPSSLESPNVEIPRAAAARRNMDLALDLDKYSKSFNNIMLPSNGYSQLNQNYALSLGNKFMLFDRPLGMLGSLTYSRSFAAYDDGFVGLWKLTDPQAESLSEYMKLSDFKSTEDVLWGGLLNLSYSIHENHEISVNTMLSQDGEKVARTLTGTYRENIPEEKTFQPNVLGFNDRTLSTVQFSGDHKLPQWLGTRLQWRHSDSKTTQDEPDLRYFNYTYNTGEPDNPDYNLFNNYFQRPTRSYRNLTEKTHETALDITIPFAERNGRTSSVKFGGLYSQKKRSFVQRQFEYQKPDDASGVVYAGDSEAFFSESNAGLIDSTKTPYVFGLTVLELKYPSSRYNGTQDVSAVYGMTDLALMGNIRFIGGVRYEATDMEVTNPTTKGTLDTNDFLPSLNLVYEAARNMNVRLGYSTTIARPAIREMAPYATYDFGAGAFVVGNPGLKRTTIHNYDVRWEWFVRTGEVLSASAFYKDFRDPIERVVVDYDGETTFSNVKSATVMGLEFEARSSLDRITPALGKFVLGGNLTLVRSEVDIPEEEMVFIRAYDPHAKNTRDFMGQSPYVLNVDLTYDNDATGISSTLFYNIYGKRLAENVLGGTPDVYEEPFAALNYSISRRITDHIKMKLSAKNMLDSKERLVQTYRGNDFVRSESSKGRSYTLGLTYSL